MGEKKPRRKRKPVKTADFFEKKGDSLERKRKSCPKCGQGFFMAKHKDRSYCGKCKYTEFESASKNEEKEKKK